MWLLAVAIHRLGVMEIAPSPHHCFRTAHSCAQSVKGSPTEPVLSRSSRQRLGHLQSHFDVAWHVCQTVCRRVERRDCAHEIPRIIYCECAHTTIRYWKITRIYAVCSQFNHYVGLVNLPHSSSCPMFLYSARKFIASQNTGEF